MKELRDIKIDMLTGSQNPAIDLFCQITDGIEIICCDVYETHGLEFIYHKDGEWIFYQDCKNKNFWCSHAKYWSHFESSLQLDYGEIQAITKYLVEEALKREVSAPAHRVLAKSWIRKRSIVVEEALKREVSTPQAVSKFANLYLSSTQVEETLKREVSTPRKFVLEPLYEVEEALKREVENNNEHERA